jgi:hypothetical protein
MLNLLYHDRLVYKQNLHALRDIDNTELHEEPTLTDLI